MATAQNIPISEILRNKSTLEEDEPKKKSREDWRKAKELEEARKVLQAVSLYYLQKHSWWLPTWEMD